MRTTLEACDGSLVWPTKCQTCNICFSDYVPAFMQARARECIYLQKLGVVIKDESLDGLITPVIKQDSRLIIDRGIDNLI